MGARLAAPSFVTIGNAFGDRFLRIWGLLSGMGPKWPVPPTAPSVRPSKAHKWHGGRRGAGCRPQGVKIWKPECGPRGPKSGPSGSDFEPREAESGSRARILTLGADFQSPGLAAPPVIFTNAAGGIRISGLVPGIKEANIGRPIGPRQVWG